MQINNMFGLIIIIIILIICFSNNDQNEYMTSDEAIKSIASMYNNDKLVTNKIKLGNNVIGNYGGWIRIKNNEENNHGDPIAAKKILGEETIETNGDLYVHKGNAHIANDLNVGGKTSLKPTYNTIKIDMSGGDHYNWPTGIVGSDENAIKMCLNDSRCSHITKGGGRYWFKQANYNDYVIWSKTWPENFFILGGATGNYGEISNASSSGIKECQERCKTTDGCTFAQVKHDGHCWLRKEQGPNVTFVPNKSHI